MSYICIVIKQKSTIVMKRILGLQRSKSQFEGLGDINPRGISHTVSYTTSFDETWNHIRIELKKLSAPMSID